MTEIKEEKERMQREREKDWDSKEGEEVIKIKTVKERNKNDVQSVWVKPCPLQSHHQLLLSNMCPACSSKLERGQCPARSTSAVLQRRSCLYQSWVASFKRSLEPLGPHAHSGKMSTKKPVHLVKGHKVKVTNNNNTLYTMNDLTGLLMSTNTCCCYRRVIEHFISAQLLQD